MPQVANTPRVVLSDVAKIAKVHVTTVSLAMRNSARIPIETRVRIQALARKLGYQRDPVLQALVSYRRQCFERKNPPTIAYITSWNSRFGWKNATGHNQFHQGALAKAAELGFTLEHFWLREPHLTQERLDSILRTRAITSVILASHARENDTALRLNWPSLNAVKIDYLPSNPEIHNVTNDQFSIMRMAVLKAINLGYKRIGLVMHRGWNHAVNRLWTAGFICEQENISYRHRIPPLIFPNPRPVHNWMSEGNHEESVGEKCFEKWNDRYKPDVIISKSSFVRHAIDRLKLKIPQDIGFVDLFVSDDQLGKIAGVRQNHEIVGALAVEIVAGQLHHNKFGIPKVPTTTFVEGTWVDGASCPAR
ncbi:MAG: LacI family DNA-binding transcriptional regulator [Nibricoccus sp.]